MTIADTDMVQCACGCGEQVRRSKRSKDGRSWKRGHYLRGQDGKLTPLPGPDDDLDDPEDIDAGEAFPEPGPGEVGDDLPDWLRAVNDGQPAPPGPPGDEPEIRADRPPGRLGQSRTRESRPPAARRIRVTKTVRDDVHAKIRFVLKPGAEIWAVRDHVCGATAVAQEPEVSEALADIVCDSADLLAWFTGPAGGFMKYFKLIMALQPVGLAIWAHHIAHGVIPQDGQQPPQMPAYAA